jgi:Tfp pilus assembly protein PilP
MRLPARRALAASLAAALAAGCDDELPQPQALPERSRPIELDPGAATEDSPQAPSVYSPVGKRDPFYNPQDRPLGPTVPVGPGRGAGKLAALQKFDIDQLRLQFTMTGTSAPMAVLLDPSARAHHVRIGDFVGRNWGTVHSISREEIRVVEKLQDQTTGRVYPVYIPMRMAKSEADRKAADELAQEK